MEMARKGAQHRYEELKAEIAALVKHFPHLAAEKGGQLSRAAGAAFTSGRQVVGAAIAGEAPAKKRKMSAKARKAISQAQKARWAKQKSAGATDSKMKKK
jgi:hypothetical protein